MTNRAVGSRLSWSNFLIKPEVFEPISGKPLVLLHFRGKGYYRLDQYYYWNLVFILETLLLLGRHIGLSRVAAAIRLLIFKKDFLGDSSIWPTNPCILRGVFWENEKTLNNHQMSSFDAFFLRSFESSDNSLKIVATQSCLGRCNQLTASRLDELAFQIWLVGWTECSESGH